MSRSEGVGSTYSPKTRPGVPDTTCCPKSSLRMSSPTLVPPDAGVDLDVHVVAESEEDLLDLDGELAGGGEDESLRLPHLGVEALEDADGEGGRLAGARLGLGDHVASLHDGLDRALLDGGGFLESVRVDAPEKVLAEIHGVEGGQNVHVLARLEVHIPQILQRGIEQLSLPSHAASLATLCHPLLSALFSAALISG